MKLQWTVTNKLTQKNKNSLPLCNAASHNIINYVYCDNSVVKVWFGFGTKPTWLELQYLVLSPEKRQHLAKKKTVLSVETGSERWS